MRTRHAFFWLATIIGMVVPVAAWGQGVLVDMHPEHHFRLPRPPIWPPFPRPRPRPPLPSSYRIEKLAVHATITGQVAKVQVSQSFVNTGSRQLEVAFVFPLPYDGAVDRLTLLVNGKEYAAKLLPADEARRIYEGYVRRNRDPALLEWLGTGMFKTSVFPIPPGERRTVSLRYTQVCRKVAGLTDWLFPLRTAHYTSKPVDSITFDVTIKSPVAIKSVYSPTQELNVQRPSRTVARVTWKRKHIVPREDFRLLYDVGDRAVSASLLSYRPDRDKEGYFLLFVSPDIKPVDKKTPRKTVLFVVDKSGSMSGKKIEQAKGALKFVLNHLNQGDLFNIIAYDSEVESFRPELQRFSKTTRRAALEFVEGLYAGGSTNIDAAVSTALSQLHDKKQPTYIVFLTDGLPTAGERNETKIVANARKKNSVRARIFTFGVGYDVNSRLLDKLARSCFGQSQYVRPNEDIEAQVARLYQRIGAPVLVDVKIRFTLAKHGNKAGKPVDRVYPKDVYDLFAGDQLVLAGRYKRPGKVHVKITGKIDGKPQSFECDGKFVKHSADQSNAFVEKLWALRRIGEIIDEIDLHGRNQELIDELVALATKHGILTPYTAFLADDQVDVRDVAKGRRLAERALEALSQTTGQSAFFQRLAKGNLQRANSPLPSASMDAMGMAMPNTAPQTARGGQAAPPMMQSNLPMGIRKSMARPGMPAAGSAGRPTARAPRHTKVLHIGAKTFFWRNGRWEDSVLTDEQLKTLKKIEPFGDTYFKLIDSYGKTIARYAAVDEPLIVVLDGKAYYLTVERQNN